MFTVNTNLLPRPLKITPQAVESLQGLIDDETETSRQSGWERTSTDKPERKTIRDTGPSIYMNPYSTKPRRADWLLEGGYANNNSYVCPPYPAQNQP
jgi:hypothetical protein